MVEWKIVHSSLLNGNFGIYLLNVSLIFLTFLNKSHDMGYVHWLALHIY